VASKHQIEKSVTPSRLNGERLYGGCFQQESISAPFPAKNPKRAISGRAAINVAACLSDNFKFSGSV
jgi:hypothetical protein